MTEDQAGVEPTTAPPYTDRPRRRIRSAALGTSIGLTVAAAVIATYVFIHRTPIGQTSPEIGELTHYAAWSARLVWLVAMPAVALAVMALCGRNVTAATMIPIAPVWVTSAVLLTYPGEDIGVLASGPGAVPVTQLTKLSWVLLLASTTLLIFGARKPAPANRGAKTIAAAGLVVALTAGTTAAAAVAQRAAPDIGRSTAAVVEVPATPTAAPTAVAYRMPINDPATLIPAGPGFALIQDGAVVAYDGVTGAKRWRFPFTALPAKCGVQQFASAAAGDVLLLQCRRHHRFGNDVIDRVFLTGLDAMTGQVLWVNDADWSIQEPTVARGDRVAVRSQTEFGSLDSRTGIVHGNTEQAKTECAKSPTYVATAAHVVEILPCTGRLGVIDGDGARTDIALAEHRGFPALGWRSGLEPRAVDGDVVVLVASSDYPPGEAASRQFALVRVDTASGEVDVTPIDGRPHDWLSRDTAWLAGPATQVYTPQGYIEIYRTDSAELLPLPGVRSTTLHTYSVIDGQRWAMLGDQLVSAATQIGDTQDHVLTMVSPDGRLQTRPSPCGPRDTAGVIPVPGAVLFACARMENPLGKPTHELLGLR